MVVLVQRVLAQKQVLGLQVLVYHLVVVQLAYCVRKVGNLGNAVQFLVVGQVGFEHAVQRATFDEL